MYTFQEITVRSDDKPWYDNELRKWSRKRDRLEVIATVNKKRHLIGVNIKILEIK